MNNAKCIPKPQRRTAAFSLVELVIVVVIIGVISAIAIPRISRGARGAGDAALGASLSVLRSAIDRYAAEHGDTWPGADGEKSTFEKQLRKITDEDGNFDAGTPNKIYGPYIRGKLPHIPVGPNKGKSKVRMTTATPIQGAVDETKTDTGWVYNYQTGEIIANTDDLDEEGIGYDTY